jgi:hypothetical protein
MPLTYNFAQLKNAAAHSIGGNPDTRISKGLIVNRAINHLCNAHSWTWSEHLTTLSFVAGEGDITLPVDFGELIDLVGNAARYTSVRQVTPRDLMLCRVHGISDSLWLGFNVAAATQTVATTAPRYILRVAPVPTSNLADALYMTYRRALEPYITDDALTTDDTKVPAIPPGQHDTLYALVRAFAASMEEDPQTTEWAMATQLLARDIQRDSKARPPVIGPMKGTYVSEYEQNGFWWRPFDTIRMAGDI